ncbi:MAG: hypothetical protein B7733_08990 [Myxococcales bacterium FL481]|nr:MAG: hypothetical protein B7733_08990 [Myxococcales bacterium FL481]
MSLRPGSLRAAALLFVAGCTGFAAMPGVAFAGKAATFGSGEFAEDAEQRLLRYPFAQVWPTAIRFLRLDRNYRITEQDRDARYVIFEFDLDGDRTGQGQLELLVVRDPAGRPSVRALLTTSAGPPHLPYTLLDGLAQKLRTERGQPAPPPKKKRKKPTKKPTAKSAGVHEPDAIASRAESREPPEPDRAASRRDPAWTGEARLCGAENHEPARTERAVEPEPNV